MRTYRYQTACAARHVHVIEVHVDRLLGFRYYVNAAHRRIVRPRFVVQVAFFGPHRHAVYTQQRTHKYVIIIIIIIIIVEGVLRALFHESRILGHLPFDHPITTTTTKYILLFSTIYISIHKSNNMKIFFLSGCHAINVEMFDSVG